MDRSAKRWVAYRATGNNNQVQTNWLAGIRLLASFASQLMIMFQILFLPETKAKTASERNDDLTCLSPKWDSHRGFPMELIWFTWLAVYWLSCVILSRSWWLRNVMNAICIWKQRQRCHRIDELSHIKRIDSVEIDLNCSSWLFWHLNDQVDNLSASPSSKMDLRSVVLVILVIGLVSAICTHQLVGACKNTTTTGDEAALREIFRLLARYPQLLSEITSSTRWTR